MKRPKAPPIDVEREARLLIDIAKKGGPTKSYRTEYYKHALDIKRMIEKIDPQFVGYMEKNIHLRYEWVSYQDSEGKTRRARGIIYGYAVHITYAPGIMQAALLGAIKDFADQNGIQEIKIGNKKIV